MHGGSIEARSAGLGNGSEFVVRLPVADAAEEVARPAAASLERPAAAGSGSPKLRVLVVDDNMDTALSLAMLLKTAGHETFTAHDGLAAIESADAQRPDVVLLDIGLPKIDGREVCRRIRSQPWGKKMIVIAVTGWGQDEDRRKSEDAGFDGHLVKPVDYDRLAELLRSSTPR
jgi:CheY-like chemotaxis protein